MNYITTSNVTLVSQMPFKAASLDFMQNSYKQLAYTLGNSIVASRGFTAINGTLPVFLTNTLYHTGTDNYYFPAGALMYQGEIFNYITQSVPFVGGELLVASISTTYDAFADPTLFSNGDYNYIHQIRTVGFTHAPSVVAPYFSINIAYGVLSGYTGTFSLPPGYGPSYLFVQNGLITSIIP